MHHDKLTSTQLAALTVAVINVLKFSWSERFTKRENTNKVIIVLLFSVCLSFKTNASSCCLDCWDNVNIKSLTAVGQIFDGRIIKLAKANGHLIGVTLYCTSEITALLQILYELVWTHCRCINAWLQKQRGIGLCLLVGEMWWLCWLFSLSLLKRKMLLFCRTVWQSKQKATKKYCVRTVDQACY